MLSCQRGSVAPILALAILPIILAVGLAVDYSRAEASRSSVRSILDSALLAGAAKQLPAERTAKAQQIFDAGPLPAGATLISRTFAVEADGRLVGDAVVRVGNTFGKLIGKPSFDLALRAAAATGSSKVCILVTDPSSSETLSINTDFKIAAPDCEVHVRSNGSPAASIDTAKANFIVKRLCVRGGSYSGTAVANLEKNCAAVADPYTSTMPAVTVSTGCDYNNVSSNSGTYTSPAAGKRYCGSGNFNGTAVNLKPGTYEGMNFNAANIKVTLDPGLYIIRGDWQVSEGKFTGNGVTLYFTSGNARLTIRDGVDVDLKPPTSGSYANILMFEAQNLQVSDFPWDGGGSHAVSGLMYLPSRRFTHQASSTLTATGATWVVNQLILNSGNWSFTPASTSTLQIPGGIAKLVQ